MDLIDRQQLLQHFDNCLKTGGFNAYIVAMQCYVEQMPTIEPKRGEWIEPSVEWVDDFKFVLAKCSECGNRAVMDMEQLNDTIKFARNFCPNCGADMRGEDNAD